MAPRIPLHQESAIRVGGSTSFWAVAIRGTLACIAGSFFVIYIWNYIVSGENTQFSPDGAGIHEHQPLSDQVVGFGFPRRVERYRPGGSLNLSPF